MLSPFEDEKKIDEKIVARNAGIARLAKFIESHLYNTDWTILADMAGAGHILNAPRHERVRRAQSFGDDDYPKAVSQFLKEVFDQNERVGLFLVSEIIKQENPYDEELSDSEKEELAQILSLFGGESLDLLSPGFPVLTKEKFIAPVWIPDSFYQNLIDEINKAYIFSIPMAFSVLIRKLLENLVIDVLREKYGTSDLTLYYNPSQGRFNDFSVLLKNLDEKKTDFHYITPSLDKDFVSTLNKYRETGNSGAHSIDANLKVELFDKDEITHLVETLLRIFQRL